MTHEFLGLELNVFLDAAIRLLIIVGLMTVVVMGMIYLERKLIARFNQRIGPQKTGPAGLLQSVADALKLVGKEDLRPRSADPWTFELGPYLVFVPIFMGFVVLPFAVGWNIRLLELGILYFVAVSSVSIVGWVMAGWGSDNRYAMLGALRAAAQGISYELPLVISLLAAAMVVGTFNLGLIVEQQEMWPLIVWQPLAFAIFFIAALAELNRTPFDIPVGESEVVGGPFVEYSGIRWSMFFLAEYAGLFIMAVVASVVFLGGYLWPLSLFMDVPVALQIALIAAKSFLFFFVVVWVRVSVPRMRIDQLMAFSWKVLLPLTFALILVNGFVLVYNLPWIVLTITGIAGVAFLFWIIDYSVRRPRVRPRPVVAQPQSEAAS